MECPHCKLSTTVEDGRCALCGWQLTLCPDCGAANDTAARLCSGCGKVMAREGDRDDRQDFPDDSQEEHHIY
jgi:hypothetical protein